MSAMSNAVQPVHNSSVELSDLLLGDRYRLLKPIGQGGFGKTFLATDLSEPFTSLCVIKQSCPQHQYADLFHQEAFHLLGKHPQIPALLGVFEQDGHQYLVQEWIDGQNLEQELATAGSFNEADIWQLLNALLPILQFVHDHQVIHRDIKPANIIRRSIDNQLFLVDFGAATSSNITDPNKTIIGSAEYAAPEQLRGKALFASDLYSLGVICIHLLTGISPFNLFDDHENSWVWEDYLTTSVSRFLRQILNKLMQSATRQRYSSAKAVLQDINAKPQGSSRGDQELWTEKSNLAPASIRVLESLLPMQSIQSATLFDPNTQRWYHISTSHQALGLAQFIPTFLESRIAVASITTPIQKEPFQKM
jgi:serine/threonine protein kinase